MSQRAKGKDAEKVGPVGPSPIRAATDRLTHNPAVHMRVCVCECLSASVTTISCDKLHSWSSLGNVHCPHKEKLQITDRRHWIAFQLNAKTIRFDEVLPSCLVMEFYIHDGTATFVKACASRASMPQKQPIGCKWQQQSIARWGKV